MIDTAKARDLDNSIFIGLDNSSPIDAAELGLLLRDLQRDYRKATDGTLVVLRLEVGSTLIWLTDAILVVGGVGAAVAAVSVSITQTADAAERLAKYWGHLKNYLKGTEKSLPSEYLALPVAVSGDRLFEVAAAHGASITARRIVGVQTTETELKIDFPQVERVNQRNKQDKKRRKTRDGQSLVRFDMRKLLSASPSADLETFVEAIVSASKAARHIEAMSQLADDLEGHGRVDIAAIIRKHLPKGDGRIRPLPQPRE